MKTQEDFYPICTGLMIVAFFMLFFSIPHILGFWRYRNITFSFGFLGLYRRPRKSSWPHCFFSCFHFNP